VVNDPEVAKGYAEALSGYTASEATEVVPAETPVAVDTDRPLRRKKT
jgi:hypothetical protein